jgi:hypothetical protein
MKYTRKRRRIKRRTKLRGGFGDPRFTLLPGPMSDLLNSIQDSITRTHSTLTGAYPGVNPNWRIQPLK